MRRRKPRRGVIVLVVLSLLVLLVVVGITFAVFSGHHRRQAASNVRRTYLPGPEGRDVAELVALDLIRGTSNRSALRSHDLLGDLYGEDGFAGRIVGRQYGYSVASATATTWITLRFRIDNKQPFADFRPAVPPWSTATNLPHFYQVLSRQTGYYNGCVISFQVPGTVDKVVSTRIVSYDPPSRDPTLDELRNLTFPNSTQGTLVIETPLDDKGRPVLPAQDSSFVVNGRPFNGRGQGYEAMPEYRGGGPTPEFELIFQPLPAGPVALLPNTDAYTSVVSQLVKSTDPTILRPKSDEPRYGGSDEDYDQADVQNMFLANLAANDPSFHRQALIRFWANRVVSQLVNQDGLPPAVAQDAFRFPYDGPDRILFSGDELPATSTSGWNPTTIAALKRFIYLRPLPEDNPGPGSVGFLKFDGSNPDFPDPFSAASAGIWDVDNDGDGITDSIWIDPGLPVQTDRNGRRYRPLVAILCKDLDSRLDLNAHSNKLHAETSYADYTANPYTNQYQLPGVFAGTNATTPVMLPRGLGFGPADVFLGNLFGSNADFRNLLATRYAQPPAGADPLARQDAGALNNDDFLSAVKSIGTPPDYFNTGGFAHASPPDLWGRGAIGVDYLGNPIFRRMGETGETISDPYEINLIKPQNGAVDQPFTIAELERILRWDDADASQLADRLRLIAGSSFQNVTRRNALTTRSSHLSITNAAIPEELRGLPWVKFDKGADGAWGNIGVDDDGNGFIDDPAEAGWQINATDDDMDGIVDNETDDEPRRFFSALDIYAAKLRAQRVLIIIAAGAPPSPAQPDLLEFDTDGDGLSQLDNELQKIVPFEIIHGERFNLNRFIGNGRDDNGNGVVDEPAEQRSGEFMWGTAALPGGFGGVLFNHLNDDRLFDVELRNAITNGAPLYQPNGGLSRQIFARHLYCLLMLVVDSGIAGSEFSFGVLPSSTESLTPQQRRELTAHRLAQWAINVVDFRDPDAIMTPFEYDVNPWNGWGVVDGDPRTDERLPPPLGVQNPDRRIVWGMEAPDLLLTETTAFHDRRVKDTNNDSSGRRRQQMGNGDDDLDQYRMPEGSGFIEVFAVRNQRTNNPVFPAELYDAQGRLDLGRLAPVDNIAGFAQRRPVWRVIVSEEMSLDMPDPRNPALRLASRPTTSSFNPVESPDLPNQPNQAWSLDLFQRLNPSVADEPIVESRLLPEREVRFAPLPSPNGSAIYYGRTGSLNAQGNPTFPQTSTVLLAPGNYAVAGPRVLTRIGARKDDPDTDPATWDASPQRISLAGGTVQIWDNQDDGMEPYNTEIGNSFNPPLGIVVAASPPQEWVNNGAPGPLMNRGIGFSISEPLPGADYYCANPTTEPFPSYNYDDTTPADAFDEEDPTLRINQIPNTPFDEKTGRPLNEATSDPAFTTEGTNPQWKAAFLQRLANPLEPYHPASNPYITVDWSTFDLTVFNGEDESPDTTWADWDPFVTNSVAPKFATRQRGSNTLAAPTYPQYAPTIGAPPDHLIWSPLTEPPVDTTPSAVAQLYFTHNLAHSLGHLNSTYGLPAPVPGPYKGAPVRAFPTAGNPRAFPWLAWHNRPFANPMEAMWVPSSTPSRIGVEYLFSRRLNGTNSNDYNDAWGDYTFLLNFFHSTNSTAPMGEPPSHFGRFFDYVETPSPFVGTEQWFPPQNGDPLPTFRAPYNRLSRFRDPGRININTANDNLVWEGLLHGAPNMISRLGLILPSRTGASFRAADNFDMTPNFGALPPPPTEPSRVSLLRQEGIEPLMIDGITPGPAYRNKPDNPAFQHWATARLSNLTTTNSNVFAVWITVGYFEVQAVDDVAQNVQHQILLRQAHPDGFCLSQELGSDTGEVKRYRTFMIIDRSVPVAYEPGKDHNVEKAILLKREISGY